MPGSIDIHLPKDAALAQLLTGTGDRHERKLNQLATAASPDAPSSVVTIPAPDAVAVVEALDRLAARTREAESKTPHAAGTPATPMADQVAALAGQVRTHPQCPRHLRAPGAWFPD